MLQKIGPPNEFVQLFRVPRNFWWSETWKFGFYTKKHWEWSSFRVNPNAGFCASYKQKQIFTKKSVKIRPPKKILCPQLLQGDLTGEREILPWCSRHMGIYEPLLLLSIHQGRQAGQPLKLGLQGSNLGESTGFAIIPGRPEFMEL